MANSTFSGPVRSQNGFQELVDGVWTPVGSGGGGGSAAVVVFRDPAVQTVITLPVPTEVGQVYNYLVPASVNGAGQKVIFVAPPVPGTSGSYMTGITILYTFSGIVVQGGTSSSNNAVEVFEQSEDYSAELLITYIGIEGGAAKFSVWPASYFTNNTLYARIFTFTP